MANTLFQNVADLRKVYPNFQSSSDEDDIFPFLEEAAIKYIHPYVSEAFYEEIKSALEAQQYFVEDLTENLQKVASYLRKAEAYYGAYESIPFHLVGSSSTGLRERNNDETSAPRQWTVNKLERSAIQRGDLYIDKALEVLEKAPDSYATWRDSEAFTIHHRFLITQSSQFEGINGSRRTFMRMLSYMYLVENKYVIPAIGQELLDSFKATQKDQSADFSEKEEIVVDYLKKAISRMSLYHSAHELKLDISTEGIRVVSTSDGITGIAPADRSAFSHWMQDQHSQAEYYLSKAKNYLDANKDNFPLYKDADAADRETPEYVPNVRGTGGSVII